MAMRKIIEIDRQKCDGCGLCATACAEGAIQIVEGKARLVSEVYCDGLGACLGECPQGAIAIIEREAEQFDEEATQKHLARQTAATKPAEPPHACPGAAMRNLFHFNTVNHPGPAPTGGVCTPSTAAQSGASPSALGHWPIQLLLVPPNAPFLEGADLLLVADCVPFAYADFHQRFLRGRPIVIACPKLDDREAAQQKLTAMLGMSTVRSLTVVHMEVPCCTGLVRLAEAALAASGRDIPLEDVTISVRGNELGRTTTAR